MLGVVTGLSVVAVVVSEAGDTEAVGSFWVSGAGILPGTVFADVGVEMIALFLTVGVLLLFGTCEAGPFVFKLGFVVPFC